MSRLDTLKHYYKWKSIATVGIWIGSGAGTILTSERQVSIVFILAFLATIIVWVSGAKVE